MPAQDLPPFVHQGLRLGFHGHGCVMSSTPIVWQCLQHQLDTKLRRVTSPSRVANCLKNQRLLRLWQHWKRVEEGLHHEGQSKWRGGRRRTRGLHHHGLFLLLLFFKILVVIGVLFHFRDDRVKGSFSTIGIICVSSGPRVESCSPAITTWSLETASTYMATSCTTFGTTRFKFASSLTRCFGDILEMVLQGPHDAGAGCHDCRPQVDPDGEYPPHVCCVQCQLTRRSSRHHHLHQLTW